LMTTTFQSPLKRIEKGRSLQDSRLISDLDLQRESKAKELRRKSGS
jgi:hypothetical protein